MTSNDLRNLTDADLHCIARDAAKAADALDLVDERAANKNRDRMLDAVSELRRRGWRPEARIA